MIDTFSSPTSGLVASACCRTICGSVPTVGVTQPKKAFIPVGVDAIVVDDTSDLNALEKVQYLCVSAAVVAGSDT